MPGLTDVELIERAQDAVTIRTKASCAAPTSPYNAIPTPSPSRTTKPTMPGAKVTTTSHFHEEFAATDSGVLHTSVMSDVEAPGVLGFLYGRFGSSKSGNAFLSATRTHRERL